MPGGSVGWAVPTIGRPVYPGGLVGTAHPTDYFATGRTRKPPPPALSGWGKSLLCRGAPAGRRRCENTRGPAKIWAGRRNFERARCEFFLHRVPEFVAPTLLDSDMRRPGPPPDGTAGSRSRHADIVCGVSDYGAFRGHPGRAAKGNPPPVPICVTMFFKKAVWSLGASEHG